MTHTGIYTLCGRQYWPRTRALTIFKLTVNEYKTVKEKLLEFFSFSFSFNFYKLLPFSHLSSQTATERFLFCVFETVQV